MSGNEQILNVLERLLDRTTPRSRIRNDSDFDDSARIMLDLLEGRRRACSSSELGAH